MRYYIQLVCLFCQCLGVSTVAKPTTLFDPQDDRVPLRTGHLLGRGGLESQSGGVLFRATVIKYLPTVNVSCFTVMFCCSFQQNINVTFGLNTVPELYRGHVEDASDPENNPSCSVGEAALTPRHGGDMDKAHVNPPPRFRGRGRTRASKRPDRALYTPQAARQQSSFSQDPPAQGRALEPPRAPEPPRAREPPSLSSCSTTSESQLLTDTPGAVGSHVSRTPHNGAHGGDFDSPLENFMAAVPEMDPLTWSFSYEQTMSDFNGMTLDQGRWGEKPKLEEGAEGVGKEERGTETASSCDANLTEDMRTFTTKLTEEVQ